MNDLENALMRCVYCNGIVTPQKRRKDGCCPCGSRKLRIAFAITPDELEAAKAEGFVPAENQIGEDREAAWETE